MNNKAKLEITNNQLTFSLVAITLGSGVLSLSRITADKAGQDGWILVILGSFFQLLGIMSVIFLFKRFPGYTFYQVCQSVLGKHLGKIPVFIYVIYGLLFAAISISIFSDLLDTYLLPKTPEPVKLIIMLATATYIVTGGLKVVARFNELTFYLTLPLIVILIFPLKEAEWSFILPVASTSITKLLAGSLSATWAFTGLEYLLILYPFVSNKQKAMKSCLSAFIIVTAFYTFVTVLCIVVFGPYTIKNHVWPILVLLKVLDIPVIERIEFIFILLWIIVALRPMMNQYFAVSYLTSQIFGIKEFRKVTLPIALIIFVLTLIPKNIVKAMKYSDYVGMLQLVVGIAIPVLLGLFAIIFKKRSISNEEV